MGFLDLLFPARCAGCRNYGSLWCRRCAAAVEALQPASLNGIPLIAGGRFAGSLQRAIHSYKYGRRRRLAVELSESLLPAIRRAGIELSGITFVPLHRKRLRERGFNQAERIAAELARRLQLPLVEGLSRTRETPAQVGLSQGARRVNLIGAFAWTASAPPGGGLGLVDDVCTTGATLESAAEALRLAGAPPAALLVLARAQTLPEPVVTSQEQPACSRISGLGDRA